MELSLLGLEHQSNREGRGQQLVEGGRWGSLMSLESSEKQRGAENSGYLPLGLPDYGFSLGFSLNFIWGREMCA